MPRLRSDSNRPSHVKIKKPKAKAGPPTPSRVSRPAPKKQPGPSSDAEQRKIVRHKKKPTYSKALQKARVKGPATARGTKRPAGDTKGDEEFRKGREYVRKQYARGLPKTGRNELANIKTLRYREGTTVPPATLQRLAVKEYQRKGYEKHADVRAPVLKALEQTTRPLHAGASAVREVIKGAKHGNLSSVKVGKAALRGAKNEDKSTYSDVLGDLGVKNKAAKAVGGFVGDVLLDPTTYVTGGLGSVGGKAAVKAAASAEKKALKAGLSKGQAARMDKRAAKQTPKNASRGVTVKFAGREAPGVRRATAAAGRAAKKVTDRPKVVRKAKDTGRHVTSDVNPNVIPDNISRADYASVREATRTARSSTAREVSSAKARAAGLRKALGKADREIIDAIESGSFKGLTAHQARVAKQLQDELKHVRRVERQAGIAVKERTGYIPHALKEPLEKGEGIQSVGSKTIKPSFAKGRKEQRTLADIRKTDPDKYSEDAALLFANRKIESVIATNKAKLNRRLLDLGQRVRKGDSVRPGEGEKVFRIVGSDIKEVEKAELQKFIDTGDGGKGGQYVILNEQVVNRAITNVVPSAERSTVGKAIDQGQGGWKFVATVLSPGFHVRNFVGDAQNAYLAESVPRLAVNTVKSAKILKRVGKQEEALRTLKGKVDAPGATVKIRGQKIDVDDVIRGLEAKGGMRAGYINRELSDQLAMTSGKKGGVKKVRRGVGRAGRTVVRTIQNRDDLFRVATALGGLERGLTMEKAVARASKFHFDYGDLTRIERQYLRRIMPFYTFSARNIPLQIKSYLTRPGKFANYQKVREEVAKAFGVDLDKAEEGMTEYEQRAAPVVVKWKGEEFSLSFGPSGLPLTDLNEMPVGADPIKWADEWFQRSVSLVSPGLKTPLELGMNYSFFFRDQLERDEGPLVPAPKIVGEFPKEIRDQLGIIPDYVDKRTGKKGWGWPAKADYIANTIMPGPFGLAKRVNTQSDRRGEGTGAKLVAGAGLRVRRIDPVSAKLSRRYDEKAKLTKKRSALNQRGINGENPTPEWRKLSDEIRAIEKDVERLKRKRGDKIVASRGRPKKTKVTWEGTGGGVEWVDSAGDVEWVP